MKIRNLLSSIALVALTLSSLGMNAGNLDVGTARATANQFIHRQAAGNLRAASLSDIKLVHAEASAVASDAKAYYAFNITGGGFVIVAGEDRANPVLGYSDQGQLDFNNLPDNFQALLRCYKEEIEYLQSHPEHKVPQISRASNGGIAPLIKTNWGQEEPYDLQCPVYQGEYCVVGCVATAMAQVMYYWKYPTTSPQISSYYCYDIGQTLPSLPATTFDYNNMLLSYCHWDWDLSELIQDFYTDEQAEAVAKLSRYCGQVVRMGYSPEGSGAYTSDQLSGMKKFGYNSSAQDVERDSWWGSQYYSTAEWEAMIKEELDQLRPILYSATDPAAGGHAFICDGYNAEGLFHFNFGWYGTCDGWYASTALNMTHRDGDYLKFNSNHEMLLDVVPPEYCIVTANNLEASHDLLVLGNNMAVQANKVNIASSYAAVGLVFTINDATGKREATSEAISINPSEYTQGSTLSTTLTLPTSLAQGIYDLQFRYYTDNPRMTTKIDSEAGKLYVVGHLAKYDAPFDIEDVTRVIDHLMLGTYPELTIDDASDLIDALLQGM